MYIYNVHIHKACCVMFLILENCSSLVQMSVEYLFLYSVHKQVMKRITHGTRWIEHDV